MGLIILKYFKMHNISQKVSYFWGNFPARDSYKVVSYKNKCNVG